MAIVRGEQQPSQDSTARVFRAGFPVYLRCRHGDEERVVLVRCQGYQPGSRTLIVQWTDAAASQGVVLFVGDEMVCQALLGGVLYVTRGRVEEITPGKLPRVRILVEPKCVAVPLRKHPRYRIQGRARLGEPGDAQAYLQNSYHEMNISLGGFGLTVPSGVEPPSDEVAFMVEMMVDRDGSPDQSMPGLSIEGRAVIRRREQANGDAGTYVGLEFTMLPDSHKSALSFWLAAHDSYLREA
jgi:hypothetical protein